MPVRVLAAAQGGDAGWNAATMGTQVFAGTMNLGAPLVVRTSAKGDSTLLAECGRLIAAAEAIPNGVGDWHYRAT
mgnify:CR=1 FL=1